MKFLAIAYMMVNGMLFPLPEFEPVEAKTLKECRENVETLRKDQTFREDVQNVVLWHTHTMPEDARRTVQFFVRCEQVKDV